MNIAIHDEIGQWGVSARDVMSQLSAAADEQEITVSIHSPGGDMFDGLAIHNALKAHPAKVVVTVEGLAASAASLIAMAGDKIRMPRNAFMMIHNPWGYVAGDAAVMAEAAELFDRWANTTASIYAKRAGITVEEARALQNQTVWMDGAQAKEAGFCDEVVEALPSIKAFARLPQCLATDCPVQFASEEAPAEEPPQEEPPAEELAPVEPEHNEDPAEDPPQPTPQVEEQPAVDVAAQAAEIVELCQLAGQSARAAAFIREGVTAEQVRAALAGLAVTQPVTIATGTAPDAVQTIQEAAKTNLTIRSLLFKNRLDEAAKHLKERK